MSDNDEMQNEGRAAIEESVLEYKQRMFLTPQWGLFIDTQFDKDTIEFSLDAFTWLDWKLNFFGWKVGIWIERVDR